MIRSLRKTQIVKILFFAVLTALSLQMDVEQFLAKYNITLYLWLVLLVVFYGFSEIKCVGTKVRPYVPAVLTSFFLLIGNSYEQCNSWDLVCASPLKIAAFLFSMGGYSVLFFYLYRWIYAGLKKALTLQNSENKLLIWLFSKNSFVKLPLIILVCWLPVIVLCYPGGSCVDVTYQISQAIGRIPYSTLHPLTHTLFVGFFVNLGNRMFHSYNIGLYLQILVQCLILASIQSFSLIQLKKKGLSNLLLTGLLFIYCFAPMYSNFATMTIKDTLFNAFILLYLTFLSDLVWNVDAQMPIKRVVAIVLSALAVMLFRNNGIYVVAATGIALVSYLLFGVQCNVRLKVKRILLIGLLPIALFFIVNALLTAALHADTYSGKEMLSIPFQQTARTLRDQPEFVSDADREIIGRVLNDVDSLGELYDPNISDPIKRQFVESASVSDILAYLRVWLKEGFQCPKCYIQALLNHCYGWFDVGLRNSIRYEGRLDIFSTPQVFGNSDKLLYYWFNLLNRMPVLGLLENVGAYVWMMVLTTSFIRKNKASRLLVLFAPLYISLLICIASPACLLHPRYAFPIMFTLPFLIGLSVCPGAAKNTSKS